MFSPELLELFQRRYVFPRDGDVARSISVPDLDARDVDLEPLEGLCVDADGNGGGRVCQYVKWTEPTGLRGLHRAFFRRCELDRRALLDAWRGRSDVQGIRAGERRERRDQDRPRRSFECAGKRR